MSVTTASALNLPASERGLPTEQVERWERAKGKLANPNTKPRQRDEAVKTMIAIEGKASADRDDAWRATSAAETLRLAKDRGEEIEPGSSNARGQKPMRRLSTGGLHEAFRRGTLGNDNGRAMQLVGIGDLYRDCYERDTSLSTPDRGEGGSSCSPKMAQTALLHASQVLAVLRSGLTETERDVLDTVCGNDVNLKIAAKMLKRRQSTISQALRSGLERATDNWMGKSDDDVKPKQHWDGLSAAILKAQRST